MNADHPLTLAPASPQAAKATAYDVVVSGLICLDVIPRFADRHWDAAHLFVPGRLVEVGNVTVATGGPVSNTGQALHRLGMRAALQGKLGDDLFGRAILAILEGEGVAQDMVVMPGEATAYTLVVAPPNLDRMFLHCRGANDTFCMDDVRYETLLQARVFHFGYPPLMSNTYRNDGEQLAAIFAHAKAQGVATSLDMSMPDPESSSGQADWRRILQRTLPYVDYFLPSVEETLFMLERGRFEALSAVAKGQTLLDLIEADVMSLMAEELLDMGAAVVGLKAGHRGFYLRTGSAERLARCGRGQPADLANWSWRELWEPSFHATVASATGAGDAAIAGFLAALLRGCSVEETLRVACAVGAHNVEALDALSGIRSWEETRARLARGWPKNPLSIATPGWTYDEAGAVWHGPADAALKPSS